MTHGCTPFAPAATTSLTRCNTDSKIARYDAPSSPYPSSLPALGHRLQRERRDRVNAWAVPWSQLREAPKSVPARRTVLKDLLPLLFCFTRWTTSQSQAELDSNSATIETRAPSQLQRLLRTPTGRDNDLPLYLYHPFHHIPFFYLATRRAFF